jgi:hypothetical protein
MKFLLFMIIMVGASFAMEFDQPKCIETCDSDTECIDRCSAPVVVDTPQGENGVPAPEENLSAKESQSIENEERGVCAPSIVLAGLAGLLIINAEREI